MGLSNIISNEEYARLELYTELHKGLEDIEAGKVFTAEDVRQRMESRKQVYQDAKVIVKVLYNRRDWISLLKTNNIDKKV